MIEIMLVNLALKALIGVLFVGFSATAFRLGLDLLGQGLDELNA